MVKNTYEGLLFDVYMLAAATKPALATANKSPQLARLATLSEDMEIITCSAQKVSNSNLFTQ